MESLPCKTCGHDEELHSNPILFSLWCCERTCLCTRYSQFDNLEYIQMREHLRVWYNRTDVAKFLQERWIKIKKDSEQRFESWKLFRKLYSQKSVIPLINNINETDIVLQLAA